MRAMPPKKSKRDAAAEKMADILIQHMEENLTPARAKALMANIKAFAQKPRRNSPHEKPSRIANLNRA